LLGMSTVELSEYLRDCLDTNPFLKEDEHHGRRQAARPSHRVSVEGIHAQSTKRRSLMRKLAQRHAQDDVYEQALEQRPSRFERLFAQARGVFCSERALAIAEYFIGSVDSNGYLRCSIAEAACACACSKTEAARVLGMLQDNVKPGIAARNLQECLALQLRARARCLALPDVHKRKALRLALRIVASHLEDLAQGGIKRLAITMQVGESELQAAIDLLRSCDPRPGRSLPVPEALRVLPEVLVEFNQDGDILVSLCHYHLPRLQVNEDYLCALKARRLDAHTRRYIQDEHRQALGLLRAVELRAFSIRDTAAAIVARQQAFFAFGPMHMQPLTQADIAADTGFSESTISRIVNGRYMQTPQGLLEMRAFFSVSLSARGVGNSGIAAGSSSIATGNSIASTADNSDAVIGGMDASGMPESAAGLSQVAVMYALRQLVAAEDPARPLSDSRLCALLCEQMQVDISRRTVNKYRTRMGIPSHSLRRRCV
jgi:RNA polymerase sigma-54 factor